MAGTNEAYRYARELALQALSDAAPHITEELRDYAARELGRIADESVRRAHQLEHFGEDQQAEVRAIYVSGLVTRLTRLASVLDAAWVDAENRSAWHSVRDRLRAILEAALDAVLPSLQALAVELLTDALRRLLRK